MTAITWAVIYRLLRGAAAAAITQAVVLQPDWSKPEEAIRTLVVSFIVGFLLALGKGIRDIWGNSDESKGLINRALPV